MSFTLAAKYWIAFIESDSEFESDNEIMEICNPTATPTSRAPVEAAAIQQLSGCQDLQQCIYQNGNSLNHPCEENSVQSNTDREVVSIHKEDDQPRYDLDEQLSRHFSNDLLVADESSSLAVKAIRPAAADLKAAMARVTNSQPSNGQIQTKVENRSRKTLKRKPPKTHSSTLEPTDWDEDLRHGNEQKDYVEYPSKKPKSVTSTDRPQTITKVSGGQKTRDKTQIQCTKPASFEQMHIAALQADTSDPMGSEESSEKQYELEHRTGDKIFINTVVAHETDNATSALEDQISPPISQNTKTNEAFGESQEVNDQSEGVQDEVSQPNPASREANSVHENSTRKVNLPHIGKGDIIQATDSLPECEESIGENTNNDTFGPKLGCYLHVHTIVKDLDAPQTVTRKQQLNRESTSCNATMASESETNVQTLIDNYPDKRQRVIDGRLHTACIDSTNFTPDGIVQILKEAEISSTMEESIQPPRTTSKTYETPQNRPLKKAILPSQLPSEGANRKARIVHFDASGPQNQCILTKDVGENSESVPEPLTLNLYHSDLEVGKRKTNDIMNDDEDYVAIEPHLNQGSHPLHLDANTIEPKHAEISTLIPPLGPFIVKESNEHDIVAEAISVPDNAHGIGANTEDEGLEDIDEIPDSLESSEFADHAIEAETLSFKDINIDPEEPKRATHIGRRESLDRESIGIAAIIKMNFPNAHTGINLKSYKSSILREGSRDTLVKFPNNVAITSSNGQVYKLVDKSSPLKGKGVPVNNTLEVVSSVENNDTRSLDLTKCVKLVAQNTLKPTFETVLGTERSLDHHGETAVLKKSSMSEDIEQASMPKRPAPIRVKKLTRQLSQRKVDASQQNSTPITFSARLRGRKSIMPMKVSNSRSSLYSRDMETPCHRRNETSTIVSNLKASSEVVTEPAIHPFTRTYADQSPPSPRTYRLLGHGDHFSPEVQIPHFVECRESQQVVANAMRQITNTMLETLSISEDQITSKIIKYQDRSTSVVLTFAESWRDRLDHERKASEKKLKDTQAGLKDICKTLQLSPHNSGESESLCFENCINNLTTEVNNRIQEHNIC